MRAFIDQCVYLGKDKYLFCRPKEAIWYAIMYGRVDMVKALLPYAKHKHYKYALKHNHPEIISILSCRKRWFSIIRKHKAPVNFWDALWKRDLNGMIRFVDPDLDFQLILRIAAMSGQRSVCQWALENGAKKFICGKSIIDIGRLDIYKLCVRPTTDDLTHSIVTRRLDFIEYLQPMFPHSSADFMFSKNTYTSAIQKALW